MDLTKPHPGEAVQQCGEQRPVGPGQMWLAYLPLQHDELVAQRQDLQILLPIAHRQQPYEAEGGRQGEVQQSQQYSQASSQSAQACSKKPLPARKADASAAHR